MEPQLIITISSLLLCMAVFVRSFFLKKSTKLQSTAIENLQQKLAAVQAKEQEEMEFQKSLRHAELRTELMKTRSVYLEKKEHLEAPERYTYVNSMFQAGMEKKKIATALGISTHEINQLAKLVALRDDPK